MNFFQTTTFNKHVISLELILKKKYQEIVHFEKENQEIDHLLSSNSRININAKSIPD